MRRGAIGPTQWREDEPSPHASPSLEGDELETQIKPALDVTCVGSEQLGVP